MGNRNTEDDDDGSTANLSEDAKEARRTILEIVPEARRPILDLEQQSPNWPKLRLGDVMVYSYVSEILMWEILAPAFDAGMTDLAQRGLAAVERLICSDRAEVQNAVLIRIPDKLADPAWRSMVHQLAGPRLREALARHTGDRSWLLTG